MLTDKVGPLNLDHIVDEADHPRPLCACAQRRKEAGLVPCAAGDQESILR